MAILNFCALLAKIRPAERPAQSTKYCASKKFKRVHRVKSNFFIISVVHSKAIFCIFSNTFEPRWKEVFSEDYLML